MRVCILMCLALLFTSVGEAQDMLYSSAMQEALFKKSNKVWYIRTLADSLAVDKGFVVYADGKVKAADGSIYTMADGDCIKFKGDLVVCYQWWNKNGNGVKIKQRAIRVWSVLNKPLLMHNGIYAMPNGTLKMQSGQYVTMKNNDFMGSDGNFAQAYR